MPMRCASSARTMPISTASRAQRLSAMRSAPSKNLLIVFGSEFRGRDIDALVAFGLSLPNAQFACLGDYANSRGAADMGLLPDLLPGYRPVTAPGPFAEEYPQPAADARPGPHRDVRCRRARRAGRALRRRREPGRALRRRSRVLKNTFVIVQDMFLTETAQLADVVLPAANLYEKAGTVTNTYGDLQLVKKAADRAGVRTDFELIVRLADRMGAKPQELVPFGRGLRADIGQTRGAQSGEADRHAVWLSRDRSSRSSAPSTPSRCSTRFTPRAWLRRRAPEPAYRQRRPDEAGLDPDRRARQHAAILSARPTTPCSPPAPWAATARSSRKFTNRIANPRGNSGGLSPTKHWQ